MADNTKIEWADATISPLYGCSKVSPACEHCYAERLAARMSRNPGVSKLYAGTVDEDGYWTGKLNLHPTRMEQALRWKRPRRIFVASQSDLFHENVTDHFLDTVFAYMALAPQHTFLLLTKRAERMHSFLSMDRYGTVRQTLHEMGAPNINPGWPLPNVHIGVTCENQGQADARIPHLLGAPAALRFVSVEPMLELVDLTHIALPDGVVWNALDRQEASDALLEGDCGNIIDHVICGGESGPNARPMHPDWVRSLRDQCAKAGVPFMFKQWGEWCPRSSHPIQDDLTASDIDPKCRRWDCTRLTKSGGCGWTCADMDDGNDVYMQRVGRTKSGRLLDGIEHNALPGDESRPDTCPECGGRRDLDQCDCAGAQA